MAAPSCVLCSVPTERWQCTVKGLHTTSKPWPGPGRSRKAAAEEKTGEMTEELKARFKQVEEHGSSAEEILHSIATLQVGS